MTARVALARWTGTGDKRTDPYRPDLDLSGASRWAAINLGAGAGDGWCVVVADYPGAAPAAVTARGGQIIDLGTNPLARLSTVDTNRVATALELLAGARMTIGEAVLSKLGNRLRPENNRTRVVVNDYVLLDQPFVAGGAFTDAFTRADGPIGANYVAGGAYTIPQVVSNTAQGPNVGEDYFGIYNTNLGTADHYSQIDVTTQGATYAECGCWIRNDGTNVHGYNGEYDNDAGVAQNLRLWQINAGSYTQIGSASSVGATPVTLKTEGSGTTITVYIGGVSKISVTDTGVTGNYAGFSFFRSGGASSTSIADNFEAPDPVAGPPPDPFTVTAAGSLTSASSTTTLAGDCGAAFAVGDTIVVLIAADNNGSNGASSLSSVSDASGNVYTLVQATFDPGAAAAGQTVGVAYARIVTALGSTDDVTVTFSPATVAKAAHIYKVHPDAGRDMEVVATGTTAGSNTGTPTVTTASVPLGAVVFACLAAESNAAPTADSDTTNGSWSSQRNSAASASSSITSQYKIVTAVATQTYNPTITASDNILGWIILNIRELWPPLLVPGAAVHRASRW